MSAEQYEISECDLNVLAITGPDGTYYIDGENIEARAIRQQARDIEQLRADLNRERETNAGLRRDLADPPPDIQELALKKCGHFEIVAKLRADLAAAVAERDQLRAEMIEAQAQIARDDEHYAAAMAMAEKHRVEVCRLASRLAAIDSAPTAASIGIDVLGKPRALYFPPPHRSAFAAKIDAVGGWTIKELIARPAKD